MQGPPRKAHLLPLLLLAFRVQTVGSTLFPFMSTSKPDFTDAQRQALLDLVMLAMYADGHLTSVEDARVDRLLTTMGYTDPYDRQQQFDSSVTRIRQHAEVPERARAHAAVLAQTFTARAQRREVYALLEEVITSDAHITAGESQFLEVIREQFQL
jgi:uncharacterized tellurite resistance protein B-like protein